MIEHCERLNERVTLRFAIHTSLTMSKHTSTLTAISSRGTIWERCLVKTSLQRGQASNSVAGRTKAAKRSNVLAHDKRKSCGCELENMRNVFVSKPTQDQAFRTACEPSECIPVRLHDYYTQGNCK
jgi:hypothetical protein